MSNEEKRHSNQKVDGSTELVLVQDEVDETKRSLEEAIWKYKQPRAKRSKQHSVWDRLWRKCPRSGNCWRRTWSQLVSQDRSEETFSGRHQKDKDFVGKMVRRHQGLQSNKYDTLQCMDFCEATTSKKHAVLQNAPSDMRGGTFLQHPRVLVATVVFQENPHLCLQILHAARFQVFRGDTYCYGY